MTGPAFIRGGATSPGLSGPPAVFDRPGRSPWLLDIVKDLTGVDVLRELISPLAGHWDGVSAYAEALTQVSRFLQGVGDDVTGIGERLETRWKGDAADVAHALLAPVGASLRHQAEALAVAGERYRELAVGMRHHRMAAEQLLKEVLDTAVQVAVWAAAGCGASDAKRGDILGYGMATHRMVHLVHLIERWARLVASARADTRVFLEGLRWEAHRPIRAVTSSRP